MSRDEYYKSRIRAKGQITLPRAIREQLHLKEGDDLLFYENEHGQYVVTAALTIPADQAWFWSERWQKMEREAQSDIDAGNEQKYDSMDDALKALNAAADAQD